MIDANDMLTARRSWVCQGDCVDVLRSLPAGCVHSVVTSPPYWALRSYLPKDHADKPLELGSEALPDAYVQRLVAVFEEVKRVMRDDAVLWVNLGDSYSGIGKTGGHSGGKNQHSAYGGLRDSANRGRAIAGLKPLDLCLIPERFVLAMQAAGWYVRAKIAWVKPSAMPESLGGVRWEWCRVHIKARTRGSKKDWCPSVDHHPGQVPHRDGSFNKPHDGLWQPCPGCPKCEKTGGLVLRRSAWRPTRSWEYIFMFTKSERYYADQEAVRTVLAEATIQRDRYTRILDDPDEQFAVKHNHETVSQGGANLRDVWQLPVEPCAMCACPQCGRIYLDAEARQERKRLKRGGCLTCGFRPFKDFLAHYAQFPTLLPYLCLKASMSAHGYCPTCGAPWARVIERIDTGATQKMGDNWDTGHGAHGSFHRNGREEGQAGVPVMASRTLSWLPTCTCPPHEPVPGLALDPFAGSGRTLIAALKLGHRALGIELHPGYVAMARRMVENHERENETPLLEGESYDPQDPKDRQGISRRTTND